MSLNLAAILENSVTQPVIEEWLSSPAKDVLARLAHFSENDQSNHLTAPSERNPHSHQPRNSMAPACIHQSCTASTHPPSLYHYSEATPTETSISTGLASRLSGVPLLEEVNGVLERRPNQMRQPAFECSFWFLSCSYVSHDQEEWRTHCLSHFRGEEPPRSVQCPLCEDFKYTCDDGNIAWNHRQDHMAYHHSVSRETLKTSRPDFQLFQHLWQKRLIDDQDLKELKGGNHNLTRPPSHFSVSNGRRERLGRQRDGRGMRRTHIGQLPRSDEHTSDVHIGKIAEVWSHGRPNHSHRSSPRADSSHISIREKKSTSIPDHQSVASDHQEITGQSDSSVMLVNAGDSASLPDQELRQTVFTEMKRDLIPVPMSAELASTHNGSEAGSESSRPASHSQSLQPSRVSEEESLLSEAQLSEETGSTSSSSESNLSKAVTDGLKEEYLTLLLQSFSAKHGHPESDASGDKGGTEGSNIARNGKHRAASPPTTDNPQTQPPKTNRRRASGKAGRDDQDDEDGDDCEKPSGDDPPENNESGPGKTVLFACPFVKRYPHRYLRCFYHELKDVSRVKQHLFRDKTHRLPIYCARCSDTFEREDLRDAHAREGTCSIKAQVNWEGITELQRRQLSKRSISRTPEENWNDVFRILFPGEPFPSSPYVDVALTGELRAFREHMLVEGPRVWNDILSSRLPDNLRPYLEELQSLHDTFYADAVTRLCASWHLRCSSNSTKEPQLSHQSQPTVAAASTSNAISAENPRAVVSFSDYSLEAASETIIGEPPNISSSAQPLPIFTEPTLSQMPIETQIYYEPQPAFEKSSNPAISTENPSYGMRLATANDQIDQGALNFIRGMPTPSPAATTRPKKPTGNHRISNIFQVHDDHSTNLFDPAIVPESAYDDFFLQDPENFFDILDTDAFYG